jgi:transposase
MYNKRSRKGRCSGMRKYTKEFKVQICELVLKDGVKHNEIAERYGLNVTMIYRWVEQYQKKGNEAFVGTGHLSPTEAMLKKVLKENEDLKLENEILKKAAAYFAKHPEERSGSHKKS